MASLIDDIESGSYVPENISSVEVVGSLPADPVAGTAYIIDGNLNIDQDFTFQDGLLAVRGEIVIGQNGSIINSYGTCPNGEPAVGILATQKVHLNQGATVQDAQIIAGGNLQIEQNANFSGSAIVRGDAQVQQTPVLSDCVNAVGAELGIFSWVRLVE